MAKFDVGQSVLVQVDSSQPLVPGTVKSHRGRGWYTVTLLDNGTIKCRSGQLQVTTQSKSSSTGTTATVEVQDGDPVTFAPPPPTIHDLDALIASRPQDSPTDPLFVEALDQAEHHAKVRKWVVFTDLHCAPATLDTSLQVLQRVHDEALKRNGGVLFLGDFWHHRGTIRVDCLNAILDNLNRWKVPMIMIPGNHDQVTLGGHEHGLTPLSNAYRIGDVPGPLILSYPTKYMDAFFVPHVRDVSTMESIIQSEGAKSSSALFVHADVTGAYMNDLIVSQAGVPASSFPPDKLIFSGHFHKPHTVRNKNVLIEYLGSPYQISLAEAHQSKALAVLDASHGWACVEYVGLDIGRRHFKVTTAGDLLRLKVHDYGVDTQDTVRAGDRVVASLERSLLDSSDQKIQSHLSALRKAGAVVEVQAAANSQDKPARTSVAFANFEQMTPVSAWREFLDDGVARGSLAKEHAQPLLDLGLEIISEVESEHSDSSSIGSDRRQFDIESVDVQGFGPFQSTVSYPMKDRGLVLLRGTNRDGGSDSNGSGKSSLAMAALWGLMGSLDARRVQDAKVSDVVNDSTSAAKVSVRGTANGKEFMVSRTKTGSKGTLVFQLDGEDLTTQSVKETQELIEEKLGISMPLLCRTIFHGQHAVNDLLEATDAKFKEDLSLSVALDLWQAAAALARSKARQSNSRASELTGMIRMRTEDVEKLEERIFVQEENMRGAEAEIEVVKQKLLEEDQKTEDQDRKEHLRRLEGELTSTFRHLEALKVSKDAALEAMQRERAPLDEVLLSLQSAAAKQASDCASLERKLSRAQLDAESSATRVAELESQWSVDLTEWVEHEFVLPENCPTCMQPIGSTSEVHGRQSLREQAVKDIESALALRAKSAISLERIGHDLNQTLVIKKQIEADLASKQASLLTLSSEWASKIASLDSEIALEQQNQIRLSKEVSAVASSISSSTQDQSRNSELQRLVASLAVQEDGQIELKKQVEQARSLLKEFDVEQKECMKSETLLKEISTLFGQRGVQAFVLQDVVASLESLTQAYLTELSDGSQKLELSIDAGERISRTAYVRKPDGEFAARPLAALSGGQWRRCSLALTLGFAELMARRGKLSSSLLVLDEPLTHLDRSGRSNVGTVLRSLLSSSEDDAHKALPVSTILLILQDLAAEELEEAFDCIDEVVKADGVSFVNVDGAL